MRNAARPTRRSRPPHRAKLRALLTALMSLALIASGTASIATPTAQDAPDRAEIEALLRESIEGDPAATSGQDVPEADGATGAAAGIGTMAVGVPSANPASNQAKIIVQAGGERTGTGSTSQSVSPLAGVIYQLFHRSSEGTTGGTAVPELCTTDATGRCGVIVDLPNNSANYYYAVAQSAPSTWVAPTSWSTGPNFRFETGQITRNGSTSSRVVTLPDSFNGTVDEPTWANVRQNNPLPLQCGIDLAVVVDLSNSVTNPNPPIPGLFAQYKTAGNMFVDALTGTPSRIALHTFATNAPANGSANGPMRLTSVATASSASAVKARIDGFTQTPENMQGGTNWDRGFHRVAEATEAYDLVLFLTDGAPTFHRDQRGSGNTTTIREVNEAIHSANAVKALPSAPAVLAVGIGPDASTDAAAHRLSLLSGPTEGVDFVRTGFDELGATLRDLATANCGGTLTVLKQLVDETGGVVDDSPGGWQFTATTDEPVLEDGNTTVPILARSTDPDTGSVNFGIDFGTRLVPQSVTVTETQQESFELVQQDGENAVCFAGGARVPVTGSGELGFQVDVEPTDIVTCTVLNRQVLPEYDDLTVTTRALPAFARDYDWAIDKVARENRVEVPAGGATVPFTYDVQVTPSAPTDSTFTVSGIITVTNPNEDVTFTGVDVTDELPGASCTVLGGTGLEIGPGDSRSVSYSCALPDATASTTGANTAEATWDAAAFPGTTGTASVETSFDFAAVSPRVTDGSVVVTDTEIDLEGYADDERDGNIVRAQDGEAVFTYELAWPVPEGGTCEVYENTASIVHTPVVARAGAGIMAVEESSTEEVTVCAGLDLEVAKNVVHSYDRTYLWEIDKVAEATTVTADPDTGVATAAYTVTATPAGSSDDAWAMNGTITVTNPNEWLDITADVTDSVDVGGGAVCTVAQGEQVQVPADTTVELDYTCLFTSQPDYEGTNTAVATWDADLPTPSNSAGGTAEVASQGWSQTPINDIVDVVDDKTDPANPVSLGEATWNQQGTATVFEYSVDLPGTPGTCVDYLNTAWIPQTQQTAEETVAVCAAAPPVVTTTAEATYDRLYEWDVVKSVDDTDVEVDENGRATFAYTVQAVPDDYTDSGWQLTGTITVTNSNTFAGGAITVDVTDATDVGGGAVCTVVDGADATVAPGATVSFDYSCTFDEKPEYEGSNTATVTWAGDDHSAEVSADADVSFQVDEVTDLTIDVWDDRTDPANPVDLGAATWTDPATHVKTYDLVHQGVGGQCVEFTNTAWLELASGRGAEDRAMVELCVDSPVTHTKTAVSANQLPSGDWGVRYEIDVVNSSSFEAVYDLSDTLELGGGITPVAALWFLQGSIVGGAWPDLPDETTHVLVTNRPIAAGTTHTYVVSVVADVAEGVVGSEAGQCSGDDGTEGGGFLNAATLTSGELTATERACAEPAAPEHAKTAVGGLVDNGDGTWTATYELAAANPTPDQDLIYSLVDELDFAAGVSIVSAAVAGEAGAPTPNADWDGQTDTRVVADALLPGGQNHTFTVTVVVDLSADIADADRQCSGDVGGGAGLFNGSTLSSGNDDDHDDACVDIPEPSIGHAKVADAAVQNADGTWTVTYDVVVTNATSIGGVYDLQDTIEFGAGITPLSATWALDGTTLDGSWNAPATDPTAELAADRPIAGGVTHTYRVTVTAEVAAGVIGSPAGTCETDGGSQGGGFLNTATLTAYGEASTDEDCLTPGLPNVEKLFGSAIQQADTTWDVTYSLVVDNSANDSPAHYDLADAPQFAAGVTISGQSVLDVTDPAAPVSIDWDGESLVVEGGQVAAGAVHRYEVTFTVRVPAGIPEGDLACEPGEGGRGFFNSVTLSSGPDQLADEDCGPITESVVPDVAKTVADGSPVHNADGTWTTVYTVTVTTPQATTLAAVYELEDTIDFGDGITVLDSAVVAADSDTPTPVASWTGRAPDTAVTDGEVVLPAGTTHTYTVTVRADVAAGVVDSEAGRCDTAQEPQAGGFLNTVTLTTDGIERHDDACTEPVAPSVAKSYETLTENADGTWDVVYTVEVANSHDVAVTYDLADEPAFATGVVVTGASVVNTAPGDITTNPDFDGVEETTIVSGQLLAAETVHSYEVTVTVDLSGVVAPEDQGVRECALQGDGSGRGLFNEAVLTSGNDTYTDEACAPIPDPQMVVDKTATSALQNPDGSWTVTYEVTATNTGSVGGAYDLTDTIAFGDGITPTAAGWLLRDSDLSGTWDLAESTTATLAAGRPLPGGAGHSYVVVVDATVEAGVIGTEPAQCSADDSTGGGGFLNEVRLVAHGSQSTDEDCLEPALPGVDKQFGSAIQREDTTWDVTYTLVVDNSENGSRAFYDLVDSPAFAEGVTILGASVLDVSDGGGPVEVTWDGSSPIVEGAQVAAGDVHRYEVTFTVRVSAGIPVQDLTCDEEVGEGRGFFNSAVLSTGPDTVSDEDCGPITESVVPTVVKSVADGSPVLGDDGTWTIVYDVVVATPQANTLAARYELSDVLHFGAGIEVLRSTVVAGEGTPAPLGSWTGVAPDTAVTDGEIVLPAGAAHMYTVTVDAAVGAGVIGTDPGRCDAGPDPAAGGFLNIVTLTVDGVERHDDACAEPGESPWTLAKTSDPVSGSEVDPGDVIAYTVTATPTGEHPSVGVVVRDDLTEVLAHARGTGSIEVSTGAFRWDGDVLVWDIGTLAETATLTYSVVVDDDAWDVTLRNVVTGSGSTPPECVGACSTTHSTPPQPQVPAIPVTGADVGVPALAALLLTLLGVGLVATRRRREAPAS